MLIRCLLITLFYASVAVGAQAQTFPQTCEFAMDFPSAPTVAEACDDEDTCYQEYSFTHVFNMQATVNITARCNPVTPAMVDRYTGDVMQATLKAVTKDTVVETFDTFYSEHDTHKLAGLVGEGQSGMLPSLFIAQLWIGKTSALAVEAELIGEPSEKADTMFGDILRSIKVK